MTALVRIHPGYLREKTDNLNNHVRIIEARSGQAQDTELEEIRFLGESIAKEAERWLGEEVEG